MNATTSTLAVLVVGGFLAAALLGARTPTGRRVAWSVALCVPFGMGAASLLAVGWRALLGQPIGFGMSVFLLSGLLAATVLGPLFGGASRGAAAPPPGPSLPTGLLWAGGAALLVAAAVAARVAATYWTEVPSGAFDAVATWNLRARLLFAAPGDLATALDATNYPLLLPGAIAFQAALSGGELEVVARATGGAFLAATALLLALAPPMHSRATGLLGSALFLATPFAVGQGSSQEADVPTACLLLAAARLLGARLRPAAGPPAELAGLALGLLVWTKNEGALWALLALGAYALAGGGTLRRDARPLALGALPGVAALVLFKLAWAPSRGLSVAGFLGGDSLGRLFDLARWRQVAGSLLDRLDPTAGPFPWGLAWLFLAAAALGCRVLRPGPARPESRFLGRLAAAALVCVPVVYLLTPLPLEWHLATSLDRLLLQLYPLAIAAVGAAFVDLLAPHAAPEGGRAG